MSTTGQVKTFSELYTDLMNRMRDTTTDASLIVIAKRMINVALHDIIIADDFEWGKRWATLVTQPSYETGTVTIVQGSTTLTGSSTAWNTNNAMGVANARVGGKVKLGSEVYEVSAVGSDTSITLASAYTGDDLSGASYRYFQDEYDPANDFDQIILSQSMTGDIEVPVVDAGKFYRAYIRNDVTGRPKVATTIEREFLSSTSRVQKIVLAPSPDSFYTIKYRYITTYLAVDSTGTEKVEMVEDTDEPIIPLKYRHMIVLHALYMGYLSRKDDQRAQAARSEYIQTLQRLKIDTVASDPRPTLKIGKPSNSYWRGGRRGTRRYETNNEFDELRI